MGLVSGGGSVSSGFFEELSGFPKLPYSKAARVELSEVRVQILPLVESVVREVFIRNTTAQPLILFIGTQEIKMAEVLPGQSLWDSFNSGLPLEAIGIGMIEIIIRSDKIIDYEIGTDMTFPVGVALRIGTGANFGFVTQAFQDSTSSTFDQNIQKFFDSDDGITGHKLAVVHTFTPGASIDFTIQINGSRYDANQAIQFQWINEIMLLRLAIATAADVINPESTGISEAVSGLLTQGGYAGECPGTGGTLALSPNFMNLRGRFVAVDQSTGYYDTAIITDYIPNSNPLLGGTFVLEGF